MVGADRGAAIPWKTDMPGVATLVRSAPNVVLQTEPDHVMAAVTRIRNAFAGPDSRQPLDFSTDESRRSSRVSLNLPVQIAPVIMAEGNAQVLDEGEPGEVVDLSLRGLSLSHAELFMHYFCLVTFTLPSSEPLALLVEILWTVRETKEEFRSGGRFVGVIEPAL